MCVLKASQAPFLSTFAVQGLGSLGGVEHNVFHRVDFLGRTRVKANHNPEDGRCDRQSRH